MYIVLIYYFQSKISKALISKIKVGPKMDVDAKLFMERSFADFVRINYRSINFNNA